ncbi:MAG: ABC transporter permease [Candidatus Binatia bacterium]
MSEKAVATASPEDLPILYIRPSSMSLSAALGELWAHRELLAFFAWRDLKVRYKQTALGVAWALLQPLFMMIVFSVFFGNLAKVSSDGLPYPIFAYCGLLPWQLFAYALTNAANSLVSNERLVTKVYFSRVTLPISSVLAGLVDFAIAFALLLVLMAYYGCAPSGGIVALPFFLLLAVGAAMAAGLGLSALNVRYRDIRYALPFLTQVWLFVTPIAYPSSLVPEGWRTLYALNPMVSVVDGFRWALLGAPSPGATTVAASTLVAAAGLLASMRYFLRVERGFADVV